MSVLSRRSFLAISMIPLVLRSQGSGQTSRSLLERIPKADPKKYADIRDGRDWRNPFLLVGPHDISPILGGTDRTDPITLNSVPSFLEGLLDSAWPYGLIVGAGKNRIVGSEKDGPQMDLNLRMLVQQLEKLGVVVLLWPSA